MCNNIIKIMALLQLCANGAQDLYLTGDPKFKFTNYYVEGNYNDSFKNKYEPVDNIKFVNKNFIKELIKDGLYEQIYADYNIKIIKSIFNQETCDICMENKQHVETCCGHKYCHDCFITTHVQKKNTCSFCRQDLGNEIFVYDNCNECTTMHSILKEHFGYTSDMDSDDDSCSDSCSNSCSNIYSDLDEEIIQDYKSYENNNNLDKFVNF